MGAGVDRMSEADYSQRKTLPCKFCEAPVMQPKSGKRAKEYCNNSHRAAYREREHQTAIEACLSAIDTVGDELERLTAALKGAAQRLARFKKKKNG